MDLDGISVMTTSSKKWACPAHRLLPSVAASLSPWMSLFSGDNGGNKGKDIIVSKLVEESSLK